jgi:hypothetical protein
MSDMPSDRGSAKPHRHEYWEFDVAAKYLSKDDAIWLFKQYEERLKAQMQALISIQARAVTFSGVLSALSVATIGGLAALYLRILERALKWQDLFPLIGAGGATAIMFVVAMVFAIRVSTPSPFRVVGEYPDESPERQIEWLNKHSDMSGFAITWSALNYAQVVKENEETVNRKARLLALSQKVAVAALVGGSLTFVVLQSIKLGLWLRTMW